MRFRSGIFEEAAKRIKRALEMSESIDDGEIVINEIEYEVFMVRTYGEKGHEGNCEAHM